MSQPPAGWRPPANRLARCQGAANSSDYANLSIKERIGSISAVRKLVVRKFEDWQLPRVKERTRSDIRWRLDTFAEAFARRHMHDLTAGELETWIYARGSDWSVRSVWKRLLPLFGYAVRHQLIAADANPLLLIKVPDVPAESKQVYSGDQLTKLIAECFASPESDPYGDKHPNYLLPFVCLTALAWMRTSEIVRQYANEDVLGVTPPFVKNCTLRTELRGELA
jgi:hypothetical protein